VIERRFSARRRACVDGVARVESVGDCDAPQFVQRARATAEICGYVLPCGIGAPSAAHLKKCVQTHVLAVLWLRDLPSAPIDGAQLADYLKGLLDPIHEAPRTTRDARKAIGGPWESVREHLSLVWHHEPLPIPDEPAPLISTELA
jgi:hypothetical protein